MYIILAFLIGITIVINMMFNGKFSQREGMINGVIINYFMATVSSIILCAIMLNSIPSYSSIISIPLPYFIGGLIGVLTTYLFNLIVPKVAAVYVVILRFIGQMMVSAVIDYIYLDIFSKGKVIGGLLFITGLIINSKVDARYKEENIKLSEDVKTC